MNQEDILDIMKSFFDGKLPDEQLEAFGDLKPREIMKESLTVVDFLVELEEKTGCHIDIAEVGSVMLDKNFRELAGVLEARLSDQA